MITATAITEMSVQTSSFLLQEPNKFVAYTGESTMIISDQELHANFGRYYAINDDFNIVQHDEFVFEYPSTFTLEDGDFHQIDIVS